MENNNLMRNSIRGKGKEQYRYSATKSEQREIMEFVNRLGFRKVGDYLASISNCESQEAAFEKIYKEKYIIKTRPLCTTLNLIDSGIDVDENKNRLVSEVKELCRDMTL